MRGRKPKPSYLREIEGNPGKRPLPQNEPKPPPAASLKPPRWLKKEAKAEWKRIAPTLVKLDLLSELDRALLVSYCQAWARAVELENEVNTTDGYYVTTGDGGRKRNPAVASLNEAWRRVHAAAAEFGGSPAARVRLAVPGERKVYDPLEALEERRKERRRDWKERRRARG